MIKLKQVFCKHRVTTDYALHSKGLASLSGIKVLEICNRCGKTVSENYLRYEGMGFK